MIVLWVCLALSILGSAVLLAAQMAIDPRPERRPGSGWDKRAPRQFASPRGRGRTASGGTGEGAPGLPHPNPLPPGEGENADSRTAPSEFPAVSILKPLKGADACLEENLDSFYRLDYPEYEIIFSFASRDDDAFPVARRVADWHPDVPTAFVFDAREPGRNPKVSRLIAAVSRARHPILLISDGDVLASPEYLRRSAAEFEDPLVGLVSNPFRCDGGGSPGSTIESLHMNGFVLGGTAAVSEFLKRPCVVGKSIFLRRSALDWIGGFDSVRDHLAEDFVLGDLVVRAGFRAVLSRQFVTIVSRGKTVRSFWDRQVRWARMRRKLAGAAYFAEAFASPLPWSVPLILSGGFAGAVAGTASILGKLAADLVLLNRGNVYPRAGAVPAWIAVKDVLAFGVFWAGLVSDRTRWRGRSVRIGKRTLLAHSR